VRASRSDGFLMSSSFFNPPSLLSMKQADDRRQPFVWRYNIYTYTRKKINKNIIFIYIYYLKPPPPQRSIVREECVYIYIYTRPRALYTRGEGRSCSCAVILNEKIGVTTLKGTRRYIAISIDRRRGHSTTNCCSCTRGEEEE